MTPDGEKKKRADTTIIVAVIGLIGTLVAAALGSPLLNSLIGRTPAPPNPATPTAVVSTATPELATPTNFPLPTATLAPGPTETVIPTVPSTPTQALPTPGQAELVFSEDFQDNIASGFGFSGGNWVIVKDRGNPALQGEADSAVMPAMAVFGPSDFGDGAIEFRVKFKDPGQLQLHFRDDGAQTYMLALASDQQQLTLAYSAATNGWKLEKLPGSSTRAFSFGQGVWYTFRLEVLGEKVTIWADGNRLMSCSDDRLSRGFLEFAIEYPAIAALDDIKVWALGP